MVRRNNLSKTEVLRRESVRTRYKPTVSANRQRRMEGGWTRGGRREEMFRPNNLSPAITEQSCLVWMSEEETETAERSKWWWCLVQLQSRWSQSLLLRTVWKAAFAKLVFTSAAVFLLCCAPTWCSNISKDENNLCKDSLDQLCFELSKKASSVRLQASPQTNLWKGVRKGSTVVMTSSSLSKCWPLSSVMLGKRS